jgi:hypothetical protein
VLSQPTWSTSTTLSQFRRPSILSSITSFELGSRPSTFDPTDLLVIDCNTMVLSPSTTLPRTIHYIKPVLASGSIHYTNPVLASGSHLDAEPDSAQQIPS